MTDLHIVVLAAGQGTRMRSGLPKVLQPLAGRPLLAHVLAAARGLEAAGIHVVYGHGGAAVRTAFPDADIAWVEQAEQRGTGHAVGLALPGIPAEARVLVLYGDVPLTPVTTLRHLVAAAESGLAILTVELPDPSGYGRILRDDSGAVRGIVEHKDASADQRAIREVNTGLLAGQAGALRRWIDALDCDNAQGEYYLTDCIAMAAGEGVAVAGITAECEADVLGVNDRSQLAVVEREFQRRQAAVLMQAGVTLLDPARFDLRGDLRCGRDCVIDANVIFEGEVELADGVQIASGCVIRDSQIGAGSRVLPNSLLDGAVLGAGCDVGPFARLRPGAELADGAKVGNFVEMKKARLGAGSKANHLSYVGDAEIGAGVNIGAGTITCNYDGVNKHRTEIGAGAFIGSNTALVAPVTVGENATIGAGSTITKNAPPGELTVARGKQVTLRGWQRPKKTES